MVSIATPIDTAGAIEDSDPLDHSAVLVRLANSVYRLRKSERAVAEFVLAHASEIPNMSISDLAEHVGVSQPTVARFANAMGFSGYREFKHRLAQSIATGVPFVHQDVRPGDSAEQVTLKIFNRALDTLATVRDRLDAAQLRRAIAMLRGARQIQFYGVGNSGAIAQDAHHKFFRYGIPVVSYTDTHTIGMAASLLETGDVVVAFSATGRSAGLVSAVEQARSAGVQVIAITESLSPLARNASVSLCVDTREDPEIYAPMVSRLAHLAIIDVLSVGLALELGPDLIKRLEKSKRTLIDKRPGVGRGVI